MNILKQIPRPAVVGMLLFLFVFLWPFPSGGNKFFWKHVFDAGHYPLIFLLAGLSYYALENQMNSRERAIGIATLLAIVFAALIEIIQPLTGRSASLVDLLNGVLGALCAGYGLALLMRCSIPLTLARLLPICLVIQLIVLSPAYTAWNALVVRDQAFPQLGLFSRYEMAQIWRPMKSKHNPKPALISLAVLPSATASPLLWVETFAGTWSGIFYDGGEQDWSAYRSLVLEFFNPAPTASELSVRIDDTGDCTKFADRFNRTIQLAPGRTEVRIPVAEIAAGPKQRMLNTKEIRFLYLFRDKSLPDSQFGLLKAYLQ